MVKFRESRTAKNLLTSYAFESQATTRYTFFSNKAKEDGYAQVAFIFKETADQECEHAFRFFKFFNGGELEITASFLTGVLKDTLNSVLSSLHIINGGIMQNKGVVVRTHRSLTNCND